MVGFKPKEMELLQDTAKRFDCSTSWVIRQIALGKISPIKEETEV
jgi:hypothetical protein